MVGKRRRAARKKARTDEAEAVADTDSGSSDQVVRTATVTGATAAAPLAARVVEDKDPEDLSQREQEAADRVDASSGRQPSTGQEGVEVPGIGNGSETSDATTRVPGEDGSETSSRLDAFEARASGGTNLSPEASAAAEQVLSGDLTDAGGFRNRAADSAPAPEARASPVSPAPAWPLATGRGIL